MLLKENNPNLDGLCDERQVALQLRIYSVLGPGLVKKQHS